MSEREALKNLGKIINLYAKGVDDLIKTTLTEKYTSIRYLNMIIRSLIIGIYNLCEKDQYFLYYPAYVLGRSLVETYINGMFILKEDTQNRAQELIDAFNDHRDPFKDKKWGKYNHISQRAYSVGLNDLYDKSYCSLCDFSHPTTRSHHLFDPNNEQAKKDKPQFIKHMMSLHIDFMKEIGEKFNIPYPREFKDEISKEIE